MTLKMDPHRQPRNDRLRRDPDVLPFSTLITIISGDWRLGLKEFFFGENHVFAASADKDISEPGSQRSINSPHREGRLLTDGGVCVRHGSEPV